MKKIIFGLVLFFGLNSQAAELSVSGALGFFTVGNPYLQDDPNRTDARSLSGIIAIGGDFEYHIDKDLAFGAYVRYHGTGDDVGPNTEESFSSLALGGMAKGYLNSRNWNFYYGAGFGIVSASYEEKNGTTTTEYEPGMTLGPMLVIGGLYPISEKFSIGIENMRLFSLGEDTNGEVVSDWTVKGKWMF